MAPELLGAFCLIGFDMVVIFFPFEALKEDGLCDARVEVRVLINH